MKLGVKILPRQEVLDTQGRAVNDMLKTHGMELSNCRVGRFVELEVDAANETEALETGKKIAEFVLYNPLIETYSIEVL